MNSSNIPYRIFPLGDGALTVDLGNLIDPLINAEVIARYRQLNNEKIDAVTEIVPAYSSLTIYYDVITAKKTLPAGTTTYEWLKEKIEECLQQPLHRIEESSRLLNIPVCYEKEFAIDMEQLAVYNNIAAEDVIKIHTSGPYKVYMIGFLPGFAYMGEVDERIAMPRKPSPVNVLPGSVGIAGKQTGIYPLHSPGGWQIIGRTPMKIFDATKEEPVLLKAGNSIRFYPITKDEFDNY